jgi:hypothetical protein
VPIQLKADPTDHEYEDQIAAALLALGYYLEARLILKQGSEEVLEYDAIATPVNDYSNRKVVEVKSGGWGIGDVFKLYGQTLYTGHNAAWLIHRKPVTPTKKSALLEISKKVPVTTFFVNMNDDAPSDDIPTAIAMEDSLRHLVYQTAWWSRSADRVAQARFKTWTKSDETGAEILSKARDYCTQLEMSLFRDTPLRRADAMYDAYKVAPKLTSALIEHVVTHSGESLEKVRRTVWDSGERPHIQYIGALEHRARVAIIKNAYDALLAEKTAAKETKPWTGKTWGSMYKAFLPPTFQEGMKALDANPHAQHAAYFFQIFLDVFGGFYDPDSEEDMNLIASCTGVAPTAVPAMADLLDSFFPIPNGWIHKGNYGLHFIKGVPSYLRGAGCFARESAFGDDWLAKHKSSYSLTRWHNALYSLLEPTHATPSA